MNVLVTGGAGFIGSRLVNALYDKGYSVVVVDNLSRQIHGSDPFESPLYRSILGKCLFKHRDVADIDDWNDLLSGVECVVHLAAETGTGQSMYEIERYERVNSLATARLVEAIVVNKLPIKRFVLSSSRAVYGEGAYCCPDHGIVYPLGRSEVDLDAGVFEARCPVCGKLADPGLTSENSFISPKSIYGITKYSQEAIANVGCSSANVPFIALRYQNVYGPGQSLKNPYTGILSIFSTQALQGRSINIFEDGLESRDFVYIDDVVEATLLAVEAAKEVVGVFNVGTGVRTDVLEIAKKLIENYGSKSELYVSGNYRIGDIRHNCADISRAKEALGFAPKIDFSEGLARFCQWVLTQEVGMNNYEKSLEQLRKLGLLK